MKFSVLQENLKLGLHVVGHVAGKNSSLPILNNIKIEANDGNIEFISTNLEVGVRAVVRGKVDEPGSFTVDAKVLLDLVSLLPNKKIDIQLVEGKLQIDCEGVNTKINGQASDEFPLIPAIDRSIKFTTNAAELAVGLSQVLFAVANSDGRAELSGVYLLVKEGGMLIVGTDSFRLAEKRLLIEGEITAEQAVIVPARTMQEVLRIISGIKGVDRIEISLTENQILFSCEGVEVVSRVIEGQYPDYQQIIPTQHRTKARVVVNEFMRSIKAASIFSRSGVNDVSLDLPEGKNILMISSASGQVGENVSKIDAITEGDDNGLVVNHRYLIDGLNNIKSEVVEMFVVDANTPCIFRPAGTEGYQYVIMPIRQ